MRRLILILLFLGALLPLPAIAATPLTITKSAALVSDPISGTIFPKAIPGALVDYQLTIYNPNSVVTTIKSVYITDAIPANTKLFVGNINGVSGGPVAYVDGLLGTGLGGSGLSYTYTSLSSTTDSVDYSNNNGATWTYTPTADSSGCDPAVTNIRITMSGTANAGGTFNLRFRVAVK